MEEKELYYKLEDNGDMSCVCTSMREVADVMEGDILDIEPSEREKVFYTITPVYMTESEFEALGDSQH